MKGRDFFLELSILLEDLLVALEELDKLLGELLIRNLDLLNLILEHFKLLLFPQARSPSRISVRYHSFELPLVDDALLELFCFVRSGVITEMR